MANKHKHQRVGIFIDIPNLYHSAKNFYNARINFLNVIERALEDRQLIRAIGYAAKAEEPGEGSFFDMLERLGVDMKIKDLQIYPDGTKKADWDVGIAVDAIKLSSNLDTIVLCSGDGDFIPLVQYLQALGKQVEVVGLGQTTNGKLKEIADDFVDISEHPNQYLIPIHDNTKKTNFKRKARSNKTK